jgi:Right handed beta helix region
VGSWRARRDPTVRTNTVHDGKGEGILAVDGASPRIEVNVRRDNALSGVMVRRTGSSPFVRGNRISGSSTDGIAIVEGASPRVEEDEVWGSRLRGILINGAGTDPLVRANRVHDGAGNGIFVADGATPRIEENEVWGNANPGIWIGGPGTDPQGPRPTASTMELGTASCLCGRPDKNPWPREGSRLLARRCSSARSRHRVGGVIDEDFQVLVAGVGVPMVRPVRPPGGPPAATVRDPPRLLVILVEQCPGMAGDIPDPSGRHPARDVEPAEAPAAEHRVHRRAGSPEERSQAVGPVPPGGSRGEDLSDDRLRQPARRAMRAARPVLEPRDSICSCGGPRGDDGPS